VLQAPGPDNILNRHILLLLLLLGVEGCEQTCCCLGLARCCLLASTRSLSDKDSAQTRGQTAHRSACTRERLPLVRGTLRCQGSAFRPGCVPVGACSYGNAGWGALIITLVSLCCLSTAMASTQPQLRCRSVCCARLVSVVALRCCCPRRRHWPLLRCRSCCARAMTASAAEPPAGPWINGCPQAMHPF
jgi:hypothetical protein